MSCVENFYTALLLSFSVRPIWYPLFFFLALCTDFSLHAIESKRHEERMLTGSAVPAACGRKRERSEQEETQSVATAPREQGDNVFDRGVTQV